MKQIYVNSIRQVTVRAFKHDNEHSRLRRSFKIGF